MTLTDVDVLSAGQQVAVHFSQSCPPGAHSDMSEFAAAIASIGAGSSVSSVAGVNGDSVQTLNNLLSVQTNYYIAIINPLDGVQVGILRSDFMNALQALAQSKAVPCGNYTVDIIEDSRGTPAAASGAAPGGGLWQSIVGLFSPSGSTKATIVVVAVVIGLIAVVILTKEV